MKSIFIKTLLAIFLLTGTNAKSQRVIGFLGDWHTWSGSDYYTSVLNYDALTDVVLSFVIPNANGTYRASSQFLPQLRVLQEQLHARGKKIHFSIGGWTASNTLEGTRLDPDPVQEMVYDDVARAKFIASMMTIVRDYNLDGLNFDWEYPQPGDTEALNQMLKDLKIGLNSLESEMGKDLELSIAVSAGNFGSEAYNSTSISFVDYVYIMAFDNPAENHSTVSFAESSMDFWMNTKRLKGKKMILAIPFYSKGTSAIFGNYSNFSNSDPEAFFNDEDGSLLGYEYNSRPVIERKIEELNERGGAGCFVWEIWADRTDEYSLLNVLYANIVGTEEVKKELNRIKIFPNPTTDVLNVNYDSKLLEDKEIKFQITDITGKVALSGDLSNGKNQIQINEIDAKGIYFLTVSEGANMATYKLIKK